MKKEREVVSFSLSVSAEMYDTKYYLEACEGYKEFTDGGITRRLLKGLNMLQVQPGRQALDIACGRGEATYWLAQRGVWTWGLDYAPAALHIARQYYPAIDRGAFLAANAQVLPFRDDSFDYALMIDVVEHLYPHELRIALREAYRVLRPRGQLLIHTAPNLWYYRWGYPVFRLTERIRGRKLPTNPKDRFRYHALVHVNEQSPWALRREMQRAGFRVQVSVDAFRIEWNQMGEVSRLIGLLATRLPLIKWVSCSDIFAIGYKE